MEKLEVHALHQKGFFEWKTRWLNTEGSLVQVMLQSTICKHSLLFSKAVWSYYVYPWCLLFLNICTYVLGKPAVPADTNLHWNQVMCQRTASSPDDLLFSRVKNKQNFLIFQRNKRIKEFLAFFFSTLWADASVAKEVPSPWNKILWNKILWSVTQCYPASSSWYIQSCSAVGLGFICKETLHWNVESWGIKQGKCCQQNCLRRVLEGWDKMTWEIKHRQDFFLLGKLWSSKEHAWEILKGQIWGRKGCHVC